MLVIREGLHVWFWTPTPLHSAPPQRLVSQHLSSLINNTELLVQPEIPPPASQPTLLLLLLYSFLSLLPQSLSFLSSQQDSPPSGHTQKRSARLLKGPDESATTTKWRQRCRQREERRSEGEWKGMFGLVDRLPLRSQRAPLLSADVDNGAAVETEDEGGACVCV